MKGPEQESAISPLIAEMLMIALVCLAAGVAYVILFHIPSLEKIPMAAVDITKDDNRVTLFHKNGDPFEEGTFYVTVNGDRVPDGNVSLVGGSYPWSSGGRLVADYPTTGEIRDVKLVYAVPSVSVVIASAFFSGGTPVNNTPVYSRYPGFAVEAWVKWNVPPNPGGDTTSRWATVVVDGTTDNNRRYHFQHNSDNTKFEFALATAAMTGSGTWVASTTTPASGTWYYVTGIYNKTPGTMAIYVNGASESSKSVGAPGDGLRASPGKYQVGGPAGIQWPGPTSMLRKLNGDIRGLKTYEEALSQAEILAHYQEGVP